MTPEEAQLAALQQQAAAAGVQPAGGPNVFALGGSLLKSKLFSGPKLGDFAPPDWESSVKRELQFRTNRDGSVTPVLKVYDLTGGKTEEFEGPEALAYAPEDEYPEYKDDIRALRQFYGPMKPEGDYRGTRAFKYGRALGAWLHNPKESFLGKIFDHPLSGAGVAGTAGYALGLGGEALEKAITGSPEASIPLSSILLALGAVGGTGVGALRRKVKDTKERDMKSTIKQVTPNMQKKGGVILKSAMYTDPRNFILERLSAASDISPFEKAQLAVKVRNMGTMEAESLKAMVRSAMGFGIGALIAKFFGFGLTGMGIGGGIGALAGSLWPRGNSQPTGIFAAGNYY